MSVAKVCVQFSVHVFVQIMCSTLKVYEHNYNIYILHLLYLLNKVF